MRREISDRLTALYALVFRVSPEMSTDSSGPDSVATLDSLETLEFMAEIDEDFGGGCLSQRWRDVYRSLF